MTDQPMKPCRDERFEKWAAKEGLPIHWGVVPGYGYEDETRYALAIWQAAKADQAEVCQREMRLFKPCPFCGKEPHDVIGGMPEGYGVVCPHCDFRGPEEITEERAVETWNTRAPEPVMVDLEKAVLAIADVPLDQAFYNPDIPFHQTRFGATAIAETVMKVWSLKWK